MSCMGRSLESSCSVSLVFISNEAVSVGILGKEVIGYVQGVPMFVGNSIVSLLSIGVAIGMPS